MDDYLTNQKPRTWDDGVWYAVEQGNLLIFSNPKCRCSHMTKPNSNALRMLEKGLPPAYVVQHANLY